MGVTKYLLYKLGMSPVLKHQSGSSVPQIVEAKARQAAMCPLKRGNSSLEASPVTNAHRPTQVLLLIVQQCEQFLLSVPQ